MAQEIRVFCTLQFQGFHCWPEAPDEVSFLRSLHRHLFHVRCEKVVSHADRDIEFITLKNSIREWINSALKQPQMVYTWSCEQWALRILEAFNLSKVEVSEDGENGAVVTQLPDVRS